ncbi:13506_t:CDS:2 [Entrophospora sp. SA101]|nr:13506_t:CDS:2 [Entrophospora sp. SA101]
MQRIFDFFKTSGNGETRFPRELENKYIVSKKVLGEGTFAVVRECTEKQTNKDYALKILLKKTVLDEKMLSTELDVLKKVDHPCIVSLHDLYENKDGVFIITDLATGGELFHQLLLKGSYTEENAAALVKQLLEGVAYLHDLEVVHRDLKPENLLFKDKSENADIMITDFGLSKIVKSADDILLTSCGTPSYVAPEVLLGVGHGKPVDIWSLGVIIYTMLCGYAPFWGENEAALLESILKGYYCYEEEYWTGISDLAKDLINKMLVYDPYKRITAKEALQHPWFRSANKFDILEKVKSNLSARQRFKKAICLVQGVNRMNRMLKTKKLLTTTTTNNDDDEKEKLSITIDLQQDQKLEGGITEKEEEQKEEIYVDKDININNMEIGKVIENVPNLSKITVLMMELKGRNAATCKPLPVFSLFGIDKAIKLKKGRAE